MQRGRRNLAVLKGIILVIWEEGIDWYLKGSRKRIPVRLIGMLQTELGGKNHLLEIKSEKMCKVPIQSTVAGDSGSCKGRTRWFH